MVDLIPLFGLYLIAFPSITNMSEDQYWWWWLVHLWVEATWEILIGCIMALALMQLLGTARRIVETWLYIEVALVLGTGILGLGHHYFWIGTPDYWLGIGGFFSALEPLPLLGMVVHAVYDAGAHRMKTTNKPAFFWVMAEAFGNFIGGGVFGFMMTLPQINLFTHGTQWTVSHGHFAFWGAYGCGVIAVIYLALQKSRACEQLDGRAVEMVVRAAQHRDGRHGRRATGCQALRRRSMSGPWAALPCRHSCKDRPTSGSSRAS